MPPETRASFAHTIQEMLAKLESEQVEGIIKRVGPIWARIEKAPKVAWLDEGTYNALTEAIRAELGDEGTRALFRKVGRRMLTSSNLQALLESAIRLFGMSPHTILKLIPRGRQTAVKNSGTLVYERVDDRCVRLHLTDFPASTFQRGTTVILLSGVFLGLLDTASVSETAKIATKDVDLLAGKAIFELSW